jgi:hypothetical protein
LWRLMKGFSTTSSAFARFMNNLSAREVWAVALRL